MVNGHCLYSSGISRHNQTLSRVFYFIECKDFSDVREVRRLLKTRTKVVTRRFPVDSRGNRVSRVESELLVLKTKQRPFRFNESCRNRESRRKNRGSSLDSRQDRESSVNLLLNGTVLI